ncbi:glycosyltransferase [Nocardioides sp. zg-536]|uniref:Glycosyltransferase n=1 Tax=Nocardioides faecalis TaxID=2803858 RepID=A0A938Y712_9ACTN|nr:glycosyltransferase [Nocardioides faecalis]MBM9458389.1 glycosyltransferase [Nocardioides faecalis]QVI58408.1 glycosyltransferase [Nocardioides faecalis]
MNSTSTGSTLVSHEWIAPTGGSENVFRELMAAVPDADAICLWNDDSPDSFNRPVKESWIARSPLRRSKALALPTMPIAWRSVNLTGYDRVLASSHAFGHHLASRAARTGLDGYAYVHTPARYIWAPEVEVRGRGVVARSASRPLKILDRAAVDQRVQYAANSEYIRRRIASAWGVDARVIYPAVDVDRIWSRAAWRDHLSSEEARIIESVPTSGYLLGASRLVSYKRLDQVIALAESLQMPAVIAGSGPAEAELRAQASAVGVPVVFVGRVSDELLYALYQEASLFVFLPVEDFGIMPVEAMAAGTPVLVNSVGGAAESVRITGGGVAVDGDSSIATLAGAARTAIGLPMTSVPRRTARFSKSSFRREILDWIGEAGEVAP